MRRFWAELGDSALTRVCVPDHIDLLSEPCTVCRKMNDYVRNSAADDRSDAEHDHVE